MFRRIIARFGSINMNRQCTQQERNSHYTMKLALLGVTGLSGKELITDALSRGHQITIYARNPAKLDESLHSSNPNVTIIKGTVDDEDALRKAFQGQDAVLSILSPVPNQPTDHVLTDGYKRIFPAMKAEGVYRFVGTGTPSYQHPKDKFHLGLWSLTHLLKYLLGKVWRDVVGYSSYVHGEKEIQWSWFRIM
jgi:nucleoside-diphosphate-sugar epimerase